MNNSDAAGSPARPPSDCPSDCIPGFWRRLLSPDVKTVLLVGAGGGFDFVHGMLLYPALVQAGKKVVIGSYSFGDPNKIKGGVTFSDRPKIKLVDAGCVPDPRYGPEVGLCQFLDQHYTKTRPNKCYTYYARSFTVPLLTEFYSRLVDEHQINAVVCIDGGSDSLMAGDESGLGDPIEDAVTVAAVTQLQRPCLKEKVLVAVGFGCDRFNGVTDAATLRAISELRASGGFLGSMALERGGVGMKFYTECVRYLEKKAHFRSVIANSIVESANGAFGSDSVPRSLQRRVRPGELFLWPLMAELFAFDPSAIASRSLLCPLLVPCQTVGQCHQALHQLRDRLSREGKLRPAE